VGVERLTADQAFHRTVQSAFLTGLAGASGFRERPWRLIRGGRGRVDLAVEVDGDEQMLVIIEIKGTDSDAIPADRVLRNLRRHLRQLQAYLDTAIEDMEAGRWEGIVVHVPDVADNRRFSPRNSNRNAPNGDSGRAACV
jgi:hypothetical protein